MTQICFWVPLNSPRRNLWINIFFHVVKPFSSKVSYRPNKRLFTIKDHHEYWFDSFTYSSRKLSMVASSRGHSWLLLGWRVGSSLFKEAWNGQTAQLWPKAHSEPWSAGQGNGVCLADRDWMNVWSPLLGTGTHRPEKKPSSINVTLLLGRGGVRMWRRTDTYIIINKLYWRCGRRLVCNYGVGDSYR